MTIINNLDLGAHPTWNASLSTRKGNVWGAEISTAIANGSQTSVWSHGGIVRRRTETIWVSVSPPDSTKVLRLVRQLMELASNPNMQPVYIQWASGNGNIVVDPEDGWYTLENVTPDEDISIDGIIPVQITVSYLAPGLASRALAVSYIGGAAVIGWGGATRNWMAFPFNATSIPFFVNKFGAEGYVPTSYQLYPGLAMPQSFYVSTSVADLFKGRVTVYDTINANSFPAGGTGQLANADWIEVLHPDHQFVGDCVITNDLYLYYFQINGGTFLVYAWNINTNAWFNAGTITHLDVLGSGGNVHSIVLGRVTYRESSVRLTIQSSNSVWTELIVRVSAGAYFGRIQVRPLSETNTRAANLLFFPAQSPKATWTDNQALDNSLDQTNITVPSFAFPNITYGYVAGFANSSTYPFLYGFLFQDNTNETFQGSASSATIGNADSIIGPVVNGSRFYGFFVSPYLAPQNLQAEAEGGTLGAGWSSVANASASAGNEAKAASGTGAGNADTFGTSFFPATGSYDVWFRARVTSSAGSTPEMTLGLWDDTSSAFVPNGSKTFAANTLPTTYTGTGTNWLKANITTPIIPTSGHRMRFRAVTASTLGTDWFIDEAFLVPVDMTPSFSSVSGPRDIWTQFVFDRALKLVVL